MSIVAGPAFFGIRSIKCRFAFTKNNPVKIEQALVLYLLKHKHISLQGIGTFKIEGAVPETTDNDRPVIIPADSITFTYDTKTGEDEDLIDFIVQNTKKIKPLASADLDSFLTLGRQFLNIGKPFTIHNLGTLEKVTSGKLEFRPGPVVQRVEVPKPKIEDEGAEKHEENLFNDYQKPPSANNGRAFLLIFIVLLLGAGAWATWHFVFNKSEEQEPASTTTESIVPIQDSANTHQNDSANALINADSVRTDSLANATKNPADSFTFKVVIKQTPSKDVALATLRHLKTYGRNVIMYSDDDSATYKVAHPFMLPLADTTRVLDSLNKFYYLGKAHIER